MKQIFPSSTKIGEVKTKREAKYPWDTLAVGQSFSATHNEIKLDSLRPLASRMGKKLGKKFRVIDHGPDIGYEVGCIPNEDEKTVEENDVSATPFTSQSEADKIIAYARENNISVWEAKKALGE